MRNSCFAFFPVRLGPVRLWLENYEVNFLKNDVDDRLFGVLFTKYTYRDGQIIYKIRIFPDPYDPNPIDCLDLWCRTLEEKGYFEDKGVVKVLPS